LHSLQEKIDFEIFDVKPQRASSWITMMQKRWLESPSSFIELPTRHHQIEGAREC